MSEICLTLMHLYQVYRHTYYLNIILVKC